MKQEVYQPMREKGVRMAFQQMMVPFTEEVVIRMVQQRFSSMEQEIRTLIHLLQLIQKQAPGSLLNCHPQDQTDRHAAKFCVIGVKGVIECLDVVAELYRLCAAMDTDVEVVLRPRMDDMQKHADTLSKYKNASQWGLKPRIYNLLLAQPELGGRRQDIDMFASY